MATKNKKKKQELKTLLKGLNIKVLDLESFPPRRRIKEDGFTFKANAVKKAKYVANVTGKLALADDSGLEVYALSGLPGVRSARFAGKLLCVGSIPTAASIIYLPGWRNWQTHGT